MKTTKVPELQIRLARHVATLVGKSLFLKASHRCVPQPRLRRDTVLPVCEQTDSSGSTRATPKYRTKMTAILFVEFAFICSFLISAHSTVQTIKREGSRSSVSCV